MCKLQHICKNVASLLQVSQIVLRISVLLCAVVNEIECYMCVCVSDIACTAMLLLCNTENVHSADVVCVTVAATCGFKNLFVTKVFIRFVCQSLPCQCNIYNHS